MFEPHGKRMAFWRFLFHLKNFEQDPGVRGQIIR
jgi:hypothetical protein